ncbi:efflux RND transporter periplasmic adaptor subunit [bacterium]|nr:efflux RND transporter periplasmic adaptor subunit [bacterium]
MKKFSTLLFLLIAGLIFAQTNVNIITAQQGEVKLTKTLWGVAGADEMVNIMSKFPGRIIKTYKNEGDRIKAGEVLYKLDRELTGMKYKYIEKTSPINGVIIKRSVSKGQFVGPSMPLFTIIDDGTLFISISVFPENVNIIKNAKEIYTIKNGRKIEGKISSVIPFGDPMNGMITIKLVFKNLNALPNERIELTIVEKTEKGYILPVESILKDSKGPFLYKNIDNKAVKQYVRVGLTNNKEIIIKKGIISKDEIISVGANIVKENEEIKIIKK